MADSSLPLSNYEKREPRRQDADGAVLLSPDRWKALTGGLAALCQDPTTLDTSLPVKLSAPFHVGDVLFLPAVYRPA